MNQVSGNQQTVADDIESRRHRTEWCDTKSNGSNRRVSTGKGDCLRAGKPSRYVTSRYVNSAFNPFGVGKSSTGLSGWS